MTSKESYEANLDNVAEKFYSTKSQPSKKSGSKTAQESAAISEYIESMYSQESKGFEVLSHKSATLADIEQKYSSY